MTKHTSVSRFAHELAEIFSDKRMVVFLCGPSLKNPSQEGAQLRADLKQTLEEESFEVVLGEDDGLKYLQSRYGNNAHENELQFIQGQCNAVVLIASSPGALCELGLFSYEMVHDDDNKADFVLVIDEKYQGQKSYVIEGPVTAIDDYYKVYYGDLSSFNYQPIIERLKRRRAVYVTDKRGRPPGRRGCK